MKSKIIFLFFKLLIIHKIPIYLINVNFVKNSNISKLPRGFASHYFSINFVRDNDGFYEIDSMVKLQYIGKYPDRKYKLVEDIDMKNCKFIPINTFEGVLDGNDYKIKNINIKNFEDKDYNGLVYNNTGTIKNLEIENINVNGSISVGSLVGINDGKVENINIEKAKIKGHRLVGGIVGDNCSQIKNCSFEGKVLPREEKSGSYLGGIAGINKDSIKSCCLNNLNAKGKKYIGGIAGKNTGSMDSCKISGCSISGVVSVGAFCGINSGIVNLNYVYNYHLKDMENEVGFLIDCNKGIFKDCYYREEGNIKIINVGDGKVNNITKKEKINTIEQIITIEKL